ncbi:Sec-independent protein translocase protein TatB [Sphingobium sufflavum]|uniref:Sec-independent protein translocase protein TatB n=1 Tax=Sphingobium sufflavum TaxID=1129547 RepID=UPI001F42A2A1|nr:Sec-independent protein translocase protein TatB [Sphingobium sufflavum]MCE7795860.1 Sec-independent protein translocase protein TatB [Sphingobium sufflavum]
MLDIGSSELLLIIIVAVVVIGPKDLPRVLYKLGQIIGKGRAMTRHFRSGIDEMIRQAEMEEMEKKWAADNARIMAQTPASTEANPYSDPNGYDVVADAEQAALPASDAVVADTIVDGAPSGTGEKVPDQASGQATGQAEEEGFKPFVAAPTPDSEKGRNEAGPAA